MLFQLALALLAVVFAFSLLVVAVEYGVYFALRKFHRRHPEAFER